ncbi:serine protease [Desulfobacterales bacterium HSG16]|nr:serine protease [Desulfobacterales bacterium HSG16]
MKSNKFYQNHDMKKPLLSMLLSIICIILIFISPIQADSGDLIDKPILSRESARRIVGGAIVVDEDAWPWMAALVEPGRPAASSQFCGASLIHPGWVLTAAHCLEDMALLKPEDVEVVLKAHDLENDTGIRVKVKRIIRHPYWYDGNDDTSDSDIALLELENEVTSCETLALYRGESTLEGKESIVTGWGSTIGWNQQYEEEYPAKMRQVSLPIVSNIECTRSITPDYTIDFKMDETILCAGFFEGGKDSCFGDSGGPLVISEDGQWKQAGIVSSGTGSECAQRGSYGSYTRVSDFIGFIDQYVPNQTEAVSTLYFSHIASGGVFDTKAGLINSGPSDISGILHVYDRTGQEIFSERKEISIKALNHIVLKISQAFENPAQISYMTFESTSGAVAGYVKFFIEGKYRAAIPAVNQLNTGDIHIPHIVSNTNWWTGINLVNISSFPQNPNIIFNTGDSITIPLAAREHRAFTIGQLFDGKPTPGIKSAVISGTTDIIGLALFANTDKAPNDFMGGVSLKSKVAQNLYFPYIADQAGLWTGIVLYNPSDSITKLSIMPYTKTGTLLKELEVTLDGKEKYFKTTTAMKLPENTAWFELNAGSGISAFTLTGAYSGDRMASVGGINSSFKSGLFPITDPDDTTMIVLANTESQSASINFKAIDAEGREIAAKVMNLAGHARIVETAEEIFLQNIRDAACIIYSSNRRLAAIEINSSADGMFLDALPVVEVLPGTIVSK